MPKIILENIKIQQKEAKQPKQANSNHSKNLGKIKKIRIQEKLKNGNGRWSIQENKLYYQFLIKFQKVLKDQISKKRRKIFERMATFISTRTNTQCTSHHQKLIQKYGDIGSIINNVRLSLFAVPQPQQEQFTKPNKNYELVKQNMKIQEGLEFQNNGLTATSSGMNINMDNLDEQQGIKIECKVQQQRMFLKDGQTIEREFQQYQQIFCKQSLMQLL